MHIYQVCSTPVRIPIYSTDALNGPRRETLLKTASFKPHIEVLLQSTRFRATNLRHTKSTKRKLSTQAALQPAEYFSPSPRRSVTLAEMLMMPHGVQKHVLFSSPEITLYKYLHEEPIMVKTKTKPPHTRKRIFYAMKKNIMLLK